MKKMICFFAVLMVVCSACTCNAPHIQKGYVYDAAMDSSADHWAVIGTDAGYAIVVNKDQYGVDCDDSVYVTMHSGEVVQIQKSDDDFLDETKDVETETVINLFD